MPMKRPLLALAIQTSLCGCISTNYYTYSGSGIYEGKGGASKYVNGSTFGWSAHRCGKFKIIGYITDSRPGGLIQIARRDADLAAEAKKNGGDGILLKAHRTHFIGVYSTGNATAITNGNVTTAVGLPHQRIVDRSKGP